MKYQPLVMIFFYQGDHYRKKKDIFPLYERKFTSEIRLNLGSWFSLHNFYSTF